ncbi:hypothetical protein GW755_00290 [bacterium]|nr:hypothetical protein [bacterium]
MAIMYQAVDNDRVPGEYCPLSNTVGSENKALSEFTPADIFTKSDLGPVLAEVITVGRQFHEATGIIPRALIIPVSGTLQVETRIPGVSSIVVPRSVDFIGSLSVDPVLLNEQLCANGVSLLTIRKQIKAANDILNTPSTSRTLRQSTVKQLAELEAKQSLLVSGILSASGALYLPFSKTETPVSVPQNSTGNKTPLPPIVPTPSSSGKKSSKTTGGEVVSLDEVTKPLPQKKRRNGALIAITSTVIASLVVGCASGKPVDSAPSPTVTIAVPANSVPEQILPEGLDVREVNVHFDTSAIKAELPNGTTVTIPNLETLLAESSLGVSTTINADSGAKVRGYTLDSEGNPIIDGVVKNLPNGSPVVVVGIKKASDEAPAPEDNWALLEDGTSVAASLVNLVSAERLIGTGGDQASLEKMNEELAKVTGLSVGEVALLPESIRSILIRGAGSSYTIEGYSVAALLPNSNLFVLTGPDGRIVFSPADSIASVLGLSAEEYSNLMANISVVVNPQTLGDLSIYMGTVLSVDFATEYSQGVPNFEAQNIPTELSSRFPDLSIRGKESTVPPRLVQTILGRDVTVAVWDTESSNWVQSGLTQAELEEIESSNVILFNDGKGDGNKKPLELGPFYEDTVGSLALYGIAASDYKFTQVDILNKSDGTPTGWKFGSLSIDIYQKDVDGSYTAQNWLIQSGSVFISPNGKRFTSIVQQGGSTIGIGELPEHLFPDRDLGDGGSFTKVGNSPTPNTPISVGEPVVLWWQNFASDNGYAEKVASATGSLGDYLSSGNLDGTTVRLAGLALQRGVDANFTLGGYSLARFTMEEISAAISSHSPLPVPEGLFSGGPGFIVRFPAQK